MNNDSDDALSRYGQARVTLAECDARVEAIGLKAHTASHGAPLTRSTLDDAQKSLHQLMDACEAFMDAARELADTLG